MYLDVRIDAQAIHHEFYHMLSLRDGRKGHLDWFQQNTDGFLYGHGNLAKALRGKWRDPSNAPKGFITAYSMVYIEEDKAEVFSFMAAGPKRLAEKCAGDDVLASKVRLMEEELGELAWIFADGRQGIGPAVGQR